MYKAILFSCPSAPEYFLTAKTAKKKRKERKGKEDSQCASA